MSAPNKSTQDLMIQCANALPALASDESFDNFLQSLHIRSQSTRGQLFRLAVAASSDPRFHTFLNICLNQKAGDKPDLYITFVQAARLAKITLPEFEQFWMNAKANRAKFKVMDRIDELTDELFKDAIVEENVCSMCDGSGIVQREGKPDKICPECRGKGTTRINTELAKDARKTLMKMSGLVKDEPTVVINQDMRSVGLESLHARTADVPFDLDAREETE